jgi:uncharacterized damage-inducible protein DinB/GNAT superfamily N-acetyltransferase
MSQIEVVEADTGLVAVAAELFDAYRQFYGQPSDLAGATEFLAARLAARESVVLLAVEGMPAVGVGLAQVYPSFSSVRMRPIWILNDLFVAPADRRRGIGSLLLDAVAMRARAAGACRSSSRLPRTTARRSPSTVLPGTAWTRCSTITSCCWDSGRWSGRNGVAPNGEATMHYEFVAIPDAEVPEAIEPAFAHAVVTYASEANKTASMWRAVPDALLDFRPHEKVNTVRTILVHQLLSERRFFAHFVGTTEPPVEELLPTGEKPGVAAYLEKYVGLARLRLPQLAAGTRSWWLEERPFFGGLVRQRVWVFWRRVLHTCHHRTQVQTWLRLAGHELVPAIYGPSGDVTWDEADPTYSIEAARRGA